MLQIINLKTYLLLKKLIYYLKNLKNQSIINVKLKESVDILCLYFFYQVFLFSCMTLEAKILSNYSGLERKENPSLYFFSKFFSHIYRKYAM
jgi:hypothetical protein